MSISTHNHEGYYDPTVYNALSNIEVADRKTKFRPIVFISSPYAGNVKANVEAAKRYCRFAITKHCIPIAPHLLYPQVLDDSDPAQRKLGLFMAIALLTKCAELWVFGTKISKGMAGEISRAERRRMPIRYFTTKCKEVHHEDYNQRR